MEHEILVIFVNESDRIHHHPAVDYIIREALTANLAGASAFRAVEGFGIHHHLHRETLLSMTDDEGVAVAVVDTPAKLDAFVASLVDAGVKGNTLRMPATMGTLS
jgi:PII-like signaling protein